MVKFTIFFLIINKFIIKKFKMFESIRWNWQQNLLGDKKVEFQQDREEKHLTFYI